MALIGNRTAERIVGTPMRSRRPLRHVAVVAGLVLAASGCGTDRVETAGSGVTTTTTAKPTTTTTLPSPPDEDQVVWQVSTGGGFVPMEVADQEVPEITIYADGRAFVTPLPDEGDSFDDPARFEVATVDPDDLQRFLDDAAATALFGDEPADMGSPNVTDMPSTSATLQHGGPPRTVSAYAFEGSFDDGLTAEQGRNRDILRDLVDRSRRLVGDETEPWSPDQVRVKVWDAGGDVQAEVTDPWPGPGLDRFPQPTDQVPAPCLVIDGAEAKQVYEAALDHDGTRWRVANGVRSFTVTPLLPGEEGCPEL